MKQIRIFADHYSWNRKVQIRKPTNGLLTADGYIFYHSMPFQLIKCHRQITDEHGLQIDQTPRFTKDEDEQIRQNWDEFRLKNGLEKHIFYYIGFVLHKEGQNEISKKEGEELHKLGFYPSLCRNLTTRTARSVRNRITIIFDEWYDGKMDVLTGKVKNEFVRTLHQLKNLRRACEEMRIPLGIAINSQDVMINVYKIQEAVAFTSDSDSDDDDEEKESEAVDVMVVYTYIKCLHKSVIDGSMNYHKKSFDWEKFEESMKKERDGQRIYEIWQREKKQLWRTTRKRIVKASTKLYKYVDPTPTVKEKLMLFYEAAIRKFRSSVTTFDHKTIKLSLLAQFEVIYEYYSRKYHWKPPKELDEYTRKVDLKAIDERIEKLLRKRKREVPRFRISVRYLDGKSSPVVKKRRRMESMTEFEEQEGEKEVESTSINDETSMRTENDTTRFEYSETDESNLQNSLPLNETVLAKGGNVIQSNYNDSKLDLNESANGYESLIIKIPEVDISKTNAVENKPIVPQGPVDNWLDLL